MAYGIPVQSHLSESKGEIEFVKFLRPEDPFYGDSYNDYDLFGKNDDTDTDVKTVMAHCVWSSEEEIKLMKNNGVFVAHCPASNMNLTSGMHLSESIWISVLTLALAVTLLVDTANRSSEQSRIQFRYPRCISGWWTNAISPLYFRKRSILQQRAVAHSSARSAALRMDTNLMQLSWMTVCCLIRRTESCGTNGTGSLSWAGREKYSGEIRSRSKYIDIRENPNAEKTKKVC